MTVPAPPEGYGLITDGHTELGDLVLVRGRWLEMPRAYVKNDVRGFGAVARAPGVVRQVLDARRAFLNRAVGRPTRLYLGVTAWRRLEGWVWDSLNQEVKVEEGGMLFGMTIHRNDADEIRVE